MKILIPSNSLSNFFRGGVTSRERPVALDNPVAQTQSNLHSIQEQRAPFSRLSGDVPASDNRQPLPDKHTLIVAHGTGESSQNNHYNDPTARKMLPGFSQYRAAQDNLATQRDAQGTRLEDSPKLTYADRQLNRLQRLGVQNCDVIAVSAKNSGTNTKTTRGFLHRINPLKNEKHAAEAIVKQVLSAPETRHKLAITPSNRPVHLTGIHLKGQSRGCAATLKAAALLKQNHNIEVASIDLEHPVLNAKSAMKNAAKKYVKCKPMLPMTSTRWNLAKALGQSKPAGTSKTFQHTQLRVLHAEQDVFLDSGDTETLGSLLKDNFEHVATSSDPGKHMQAQLGANHLLFQSPDQSGLRARTPQASFFHGMRG